MPRPSERQRALAAAQAACADWVPVIEGQIDIFSALDEGALEERSKSSSCLQRKEEHEERHAD